MRSFCYVSVEAPSPPRIPHGKAPDPEKQLHRPATRLRPSRQPRPKIHQWTLTILLPQCGLSGTKSDLVPLRVANNLGFWIPPSGHLSSVNSTVPSEFRVGSSDNWFRRANKTSLR